MKRINKSIDRLSEILYQKGYDGIYVLDNQHTGRLPDLLKTHLFEAISDPMKEILPVKLRTIITLPDKKDRFLSSESLVDYDTKKGVHLTDLSYQITNSITGKPVYGKSISLNEYSILPSALKAERDMKNKPVKKKKRMKF